MTFKITKDHILENILKGKRLDSRALDEFREIKIETGVSCKAEGSALVHLGKTKVVAGIKMTTGEPYPDSQDEGVMATSAEYLPMGSPDFESGPPREDEIELGRVVDRAIRESKSIDFKKLCITKGEKVWMVFLDIYVLDHDGNLIDACGIAAAAALKSAKMPAIDKDGKIDYDKHSGSIPMNGTPISITIRCHEGNYIVDANADEEEAMPARVTVGTMDDGSISSLQKGGTRGFTREEIEAIINLATKTGDDIRKKYFK